jgi:hypothetical protein
MDQRLKLAPPKIWPLSPRLLPVVIISVIALTGLILAMSWHAKPAIQNAYNDPFGTRFGVACGLTYDPYNIGVRNQRVNCGEPRSSFVEFLQGLGYESGVLVILFALIYALLYWFSNTYAWEAAIMRLFKRLRRISMALIIALGLIFALAQGGLFNYRYGSMVHDENGDTGYSYMLGRLYEITIGTASKQYGLSERVTLPGVVIGVSLMTFGLLMLGLLTLALLTVSEKFGLRGHLVAVKPRLTRLVVILTATVIVAILMSGYALANSSWGVRNVAWPLVMIKF